MAISKNISIDQGSTVSIQFQATDGVGGPIIPLGSESAAIVTSEMKKMYNAYTSYPFTVTIDDIEEGLFTISMTPEQSSLITGGRYVYDVEMELDGVVTRLFEGVVLVKPQVTSSNPFVSVEGVNFGEGNLVHSHDNIPELENFHVFVEAGTIESVEWGKKYIIDGSIGTFELNVPANPSVGFDFEFIEKNSDIGTVIIQDTNGVIDTITVEGYYKALWTGAVWKIIKVA